LPIDGPLSSSRIAASGEPLWLEAPDQVRADAASLIAECRRSAVATLPLRAGDRVIGSIAFGFDEPHALDDAERRFLVSVAEQCAVAVDRSMLLEDERRAREAERAGVWNDRAGGGRADPCSTDPRTRRSASAFDRELRFQQVNRGSPTEQAPGGSSHRADPAAPVPGRWTRSSEGQKNPETGSQ
jgi:hypothetical protein